MRHHMTLLAAGAIFPSTGAAHAQPGMVLSHQKISDTEAGFAGILDDSDSFGVHVASLGDLDGDGVGDLAVGAHGDDDGGPRNAARCGSCSSGEISSEGQRHPGRIHRHAG